MIKNLPENKIYIKDERVNNTFTPFVLDTSNMTTPTIPTLTPQNIPTGKSYTKEFSTPGFHNPNQGNGKIVPFRAKTYDPTIFTFDEKPLNLAPEDDMNEPEMDFTYLIGDNSNDTK